MINLYLMAVDLGTSFIKAGIYDLEGNCIANVSELADGEKHGQGIYIQQGEMLLKKVIACIRKAVQKMERQSFQIEAVVFTGQMAGFIGVDKEWNDITGWSCSLDTRYLPYAEMVNKKYGEVISRTSGTCAPLMAPKILWFNQKFPEEAKKIAKYGMINSYILGRLSDCSIEQMAMDSSLLTWSGLADIRKRNWSSEICREFPIDMQQLPRIVPADQICGFLSKTAANMTGLKQGTPLMIGTGDKVAGCIGADITQSGDMIFEAASYGGFSCVVEQYTQNRIRNYYDGICGVSGFLAHKYIPGSGITLKWFIDNFAEVKGGAGFESMEAKAAHIRPGSDGLMAIGLLGGSAMPFDGLIKGMWMGFDWSHRPEHFYRSLIESFTLDLALTIDSVEEAYRNTLSNQIILIGGGARSKLWAGIIADITGKKVCKRERTDAALWGAVLVAQRGLGLIQNFKEAARCDTKADTVYEPDLIRREQYLPLKERYENYRKNLHGYFENL